MCDCVLSVNLQHNVIHTLQKRHGAAWTTTSWVPQIFPQKACGVCYPEDSARTSINALSFLPKDSIIITKTINPPPSPFLRPRAIKK